MTEKKLGAYAAYTIEERNDVYRGLECVPTGNERALGLPRTQWLRAHHQNKAFRRVLDFGCHDGFMHRWLLKEWSTEIIVGVEICGDAVKHAVKQALADSMDSGPMAVYCCQGWEEFDQPIRFTEVIASEVVEHFTHPENVEMLAKLNGYLLPGGRGFITTPHIDGQFGKTNPDPHHINLMNEEQVSALIKKATAMNDMPEGEEQKVIVVGDFIYGVWKKA